MDIKRVLNLFKVGGICSREVHNHFHNILTLMFYQIFLSPQVKRCAIITYKHGMYELST